MVRVHPIVFLVDVDNTLLDNDGVQQDLKDHLERAYGRDARDRYWRILEGLFAELGYRDFYAQTFTGLFAPAGTPPEIVSKLYDETVAVLKDPTVVDKFDKLGAESVPMTPAEFTAYLEHEDAKWTPIVRKANIKAE